MAKNAKKPIGLNQPVTVIVSRMAKEGKKAEFEVFLKGIINDALNFEGHLGVNVFLPTFEEERLYTVIFKFDSSANLNKWETSQTRKYWYQVAEEISEGEALIEKKEGLITWFDGLSFKPAAKIEKIKITLITWLALYPMITLVLLIIGENLNHLPMPVRTLLLSIILVPLMTFVMVPWLCRLFYKWLHS